MDDVFLSRLNVILGVRGRNNDNSRTATKRAVPNKGVDPVPTAKAIEQAVRIRRSVMG
jgi:hypothetical protein